MQRGWKVVDDINFSTFTGRIQSDGAASMAVKGLTNHCTVQHIVSGACATECIHRASLSD